MSVCLQLAFESFVVILKAAHSSVALLHESLATTKSCDLYF